MPSVPRVPLTVLLCAAALGGTAAPALAQDPAGLQAALAPQARALGSQSGALVVDLGTGRRLYARNAARALVPASNEKLLTTAAALQRLGADARLRTTVRLAPDATLGEDGVVRGDLRLVGAGDPSLTSAGLDALAAEVVAAGVTRLTGGVVGDGTLFDGRRGAPSTGYRADLELGGSLGGLVFSHGIPGAVGPAQAAAARLQILLAARGVKAGLKARALVPAAAVRQAAAVPEDADPAEPAAPAEPAVPATDGVLAGLDSPTIAALAAATNVPSDNFYAEMLLKLLGADAGAGGTSPAGLAVLRSALAELGVRATVADGSGLSRGNRVAPDQVVKLLTVMHASPLAASYEGSLAVVGRSGTVRKRMRGTPAAGACSAKTGTLTGVSALSGVCRVGGRTLAFSIISNGVYSPAAKRREDRMVAAIARYGA